MGLYYQLKELYVDIKDTEFMLQDDSNGKGAYIREWKSAYPKPTQAELNSVKVSADKKEKLIPIRAERDRRLTKSDIHCLVDNYNKLTATQKTEIETYRQALRDLPAIVNVDTPVYPVKPVWVKEKEV